MARGKPFRPGESGNAKGRPPGRQNRTTVEIRDLARKLLTDADYLDRLRLRLHQGTAGPIETVLYHYGFGRPREVVEASGELIIKVEQAE